MDKDFLGFVILPAIAIVCFIAASIMKHSALNDEMKELKNEIENIKKEKNKI